MRSQEELSAQHDSGWGGALRSARAWHNFSLILAPLLLVVLLYASTASTLVVFWNDTESLTYTHGWIVLATTLWLLFDAVARYPAIRMQASWSGVMIVAAASIIWLLARQINVQLVQLLLIPVLLWGALLAVFGRELAKSCAFPIGYLFCAIPIWGFSNPALQWGTVFAMRAATRLVGIPAYFDANTIHIPSGVIAVEDACSGLHFFIVGVALAALYCYVNRIAAKWRLLLLAVGLAVLANWVRVFVILVAGHLTHMQHYLVRVEHYRFGWGVFAVMMVIFFAVGHRMKQMPEPQLPSMQGVSHSSAYAPLVGFAFALFTVPMFVWSSGQRVAVNIASIDIVAPAGWQLTDYATSHQWEPVFKNADAQVLKRFTKNDFVLDAYRAVYSTQNQQKKIAGYDNSLTGVPHGLDVIATERASGPFMQMELGDAMGNRQLIWYAYHVDGHWFTSPLRAQMWSGIKALAAQPRTGVVVLHAGCARDCSQVKRAFEEWAADDALRMLVDAR